MIANIALGSNIGDPRVNVTAAIGHVCELGTLVVCSHLYETKPWGVTDQPDFCNAVMQIETALRPHALLAALKAIEVRMGRTATYRWGPRLIDLDLLTMGDEEVDDEVLTLPHPRIGERSFVLVPLAEIAPEYAEIRDKLPPEDVASVKIIDMGINMDIDVG
ncbi:MAG TPA: 2-amino-4-hydroxy-6-hydroxymethyldihydropteridine diphosphokinase [Oculatellaceae cyanobacterium]